VVVVGSGGGVAVAARPSFRLHEAPGQVSKLGTEDVGGAGLTLQLRLEPHRFTLTAHLWRNQTKTEIRVISQE
jgi:hypothetical protein